MIVKDLEPGKHVLKRTGNSDPKVPLYTGQIRLQDGTMLNVAGWEREAKTTGEIYIGGVATPVEQSADPLHRPAEGQGRTSFALFTNKKDGVETRPDMRGNVEFPAGTKHYLSSWSTQTATGYYLTGNAQDQAAIDDTRQVDPSDEYENDQYRDLLGEEPAAA